jgi:hypothetical protein
MANAYRLRAGMRFEDAVAVLGGSPSYPDDADAPGYVWQDDEIIVSVQFRGPDRTINGVSIFFDLDDGQHVVDIVPREPFNVVDRIREWAWLVLGL